MASNIAVISARRRRRSSGGGAVTKLLHTFSGGANAATPGNADTGQAPNVLAGTFGVDASGYLYQSAAGVDSMVIWDATVSDGTFTFDIPAIDTTGAFFRAYFRSTTKNDRFQLYAQGANWNLYKIVAGVATLLGTWGTVPPAAGQTMKVVLSGNSISIYSGTTLLGTVTEAANQTLTGFGFGNDGVNACRCDNIKVTVP